MLTPCVDKCWTECGRWSISLNIDTHDKDIWRGETLQTPLSERTLYCVNWHEQSCASHPNSGMWLLNSHLSLAFWTLIGSLITSSQGREPHNQWRRQKPKIWRSPRLDGSLERQERQWDISNNVTKHTRTTYSSHVTLNVQQRTQSNSIMYKKTRLKKWRIYCPYQTGRAVGLDQLLKTLKKLHVRQSNDIISCNINVDTLVQSGSSDGFTALSDLAWGCIIIYKNQ